jgi:hypothetical protein
MGKIFEPIVVVHVCRQTLNRFDLKIGSPKNPFTSVEVSEVCLKKNFDLLV